MPGKIVRRSESQGQNAESAYLCQRKRNPIIPLPARNVDEDSTANQDV